MITEEQKQLIKKLYVDEQLSMKEIGEKVNLNYRTVSYHLKKMGISSRSPKKIDDDKFIELWNQGKSDEEIAEVFGVTKLTVQSYRNRNGKHFSKYFSHKDISLTDEQEQFVLGSLLGDLYLSAPKSDKQHSSIAIVHSIKQKELFMKKVEILGEFMDKYKMYTPTPDKRTVEVYQTYRGHSKRHKVFTDIHNILYIDGIKTITKQYLDKIHSPLALAYWFMDDGTKSGTIATNCFTLEEQQLLVEWMKEKWNIECSIQKQKDVFILHILEKSRQHFEDLIFPFMIPSMYYKLKYYKAESV